MAKPALVVGDESRTGAELDDRVARLAAGLAGLGVEAGDRVAVMLRNGFEFFETNLAVNAVGAAMVPVNWHLKARELRWILENSSARLLVAAEDLAHHVDSPDGCRVVLVPRDYEPLLRSSIATEPAGPSLRSKNDLVLYTSGTSGRPKGVVQQVSADRTDLAELWGLTADDVHVLAAPAYHGAPWSWATTHVRIGATVVVLSRWDPREWLAAVAGHGVTTAFLVPAQMSRIVDAYDGEDLSSMRLVAHGGAACPVAVKRRFLDVVPHAEVGEFYGFSEGGRVSRISAAEWRERPGSVGRPVPGVEVLILDEDGNRLPPGETGIVYVVPPGGRRFRYLDDEDATAAAWRHGACTGGDVGHVDEDGYLWITDRAADMVIRGGVNIYPREVEDVLAEHPSVADCAVFGVPDEVYGERVQAVVELRTPVDPEDLRTFLSERLAGFKVPERLAIVDRLPRDPNGKVRKRLLAEEWE